MLRVATYNIHKGIGLDRARRPERILDVLAEIDADVVVLQEADRRFGERASVLPLALIARTSSYAPIVLGRRPDSIGWHGNAILVRRGMAATASGHIDLPTIEPRGAVYAELATAIGPLRVVGMHLDLSGLRRSFQARAIAAACARRPPMSTVLLGDTNEWRERAGAVREFGYSFNVAPTPPSFHSRSPVARLDRIMTDRTLRLVGCGTHHSSLSRVASDHLPVWADVAPA